MQSRILTIGIATTAAMLISIAGWAQMYTPQQTLAQRGQGLVEVLKQRGLEKPLLTYGKLYQHRYPNTEGDQFIEAQVHHECFLEYDGQAYQSITLRYDSYNKLVITPLVQGARYDFIILDDRKITRFEIAGREFIYYWSSNEIPESGIYERAFHGTKTTLLISRDKIIDQPLYRKNGDHDKFIDQAKHFLKTPAGVFRINGKKDLLEALESSAVEDFAKKNRFKMKLGKPSAQAEIVKVLTYFETLP